jgi:hypothetical protein
MIILDLQPFSIVEDDGFKALIKLAFPKYKLPGRKYFSSLIEKMHQKTIIKAEEQLKQASEVNEACKASFLEFILYFLRPHLVCKIAPFHQEIVKCLEGSQRFVCAAPRGHAKSYFISFFYPLWLSLFQKGTDITVISASESLAIEWVRKIRKELETNPLILAFWGDMKSDKWTENHIILKNGVHIRAKGAGGQIRGFRPSHLIIDDLETQESANSEDLRRKNKLLESKYNEILKVHESIAAENNIHNIINEEINSDCVEEVNFCQKQLSQSKRTSDVWIIICFLFGLTSTISCCCCIQIKSKKIQRKKQLSTDSL